MAATARDGKLGDHIWRGGRKIAVVDVPDRFTVRMKRGVPSETLEQGFGATHRNRLQRQNMDEFSVGAERRAVSSRRPLVMSSGGAQLRRMTSGSSWTVMFMA